MQQIARDRRIDRFLTAFMGLGAALIVSIGEPPLRFWAHAWYKKAPAIEGHLSDWNIFLDEEDRSYIYMRTDVRPHLLQVYEAGGVVHVRRFSLLDYQHTLAFRTASHEQATLWHKLFDEAVEDAP